MKDEALKLALEALEWLTSAEPGNEPPVNAAITAIEQALAAPVQEPVAWAVVGEGEWGKWVIGNQFETGNSPNHNYWGNRGYELAPLYTHPPAAQRKPLTMIEQVDAAMVATKHIYPPITRSQCELIIRAAAHGIKE